MRSSRITTIFSEVPAAGNGPSGLLVSAGVHVFLFSALISGLRTTVRERDVAEVRQYSVRTLKLNRAEPQRRRAASKEVSREAVRDAIKEIAERSASPQASAAAAAPDLLPAKLHAPQTLLQPDLTKPVVMTQALPIPTVVIWTAENTPVKVIVAAPAREVTSARVLPSLNPPNHELKPADLKLSASAFDVKTPMLPPSTTSPVAINIAIPTTSVPVTSSTVVGQPTSAMVMSISDLRQNEGTVVLPGANQSAGRALSGSLGTGTTAKVMNGSGKAVTDESGKGTAATAGERIASEGSGMTGSKLSDGALQGAEGDGSGSGSELGLTRIDLPKDGRFGTVVVGSSLAEEYPESVGVWNSRLAYTVYLHVGLSKNWILQYALPQDAAKGGSVARPEAPWPFTIVRPQSPTSDLNADAIMIHGIVNVLGRFDAVSVVFPVEFAEKKLLLSALQQWRFRPARQNGQLTPVEVLLIIPEELQ